MMIAFVSNYFNHHQRLFCNEIKKHCDEFYFISTRKMNDEREKLGYKELGDEVDYVLKTYDGSTSTERVKEILSRSDAVIFGECPESYAEFRMRQHKLSFLYSERLFKNGVWRRFIPHIIKKVINKVVRYADEEMYVLCAGAFLCWELSLCGFPEEKCFQWGYFPEVESFSGVPVRHNEKPRILWVGRMVHWKHGELAIKAVASLIKKGKKCTLDMVGVGECEESLRKLTKKLNVESSVNFLGSMPPEKVRENMKTADIFLTTSDFREGWGAVLNEAMSCGCAVVASSAAGATPYLIKDGENGYVYKYDSASDLESKVLDLLEHKEKRQLFGRNAMDTIANSYSASIAAERLVEFIDSVTKSDFYYESGPMSRAKKIRNNWYK